MLDSSLFSDVADAIGLSNPTIVEKDYYVVQLLLLIKQLNVPFHQIIFSGGTALAKSDIKTYRMSEDIDLKCVPSQEFINLPSRNAKRIARKVIFTEIKSLIDNSEIFTLDTESVVNDEYRYMCFDVKYPQAYKQAPCLRPYIKLELIESELLSEPDVREISSIYSQVLKEPGEIDLFSCASVLDTQAEKIISMLRRTASHSRNIDRNTDEALIRHIYDTHHIQMTSPSDIDELTALVALVLKIDIERYGRQHPELVDMPIDELKYGLALLAREPHHQKRYQEYVEPMVYASVPVTWDKAFKSFTRITEEILKKLS